MSMNGTVNEAASKLLADLRRALERKQARDREDYRLAEAKGRQANADAAAGKISHEQATNYIQSRVDPVLLESSYRMRQGALVVEAEYRPQIDAARGAMFARRDALLAQVDATRQQIEAFDRALSSMSMSPAPRPKAPTVTERPNYEPAIS